MTILDDIIKHKKLVELPKRKREVSQATLQAQTVFAKPGRDFVAALRQAPGVALIAEVKRASPSRGLLRPQFDALDLAREYLIHGASAISVLTDRQFFQGDLAFVPDIQAELEPLRQKHKKICPVLRKEFIIDPYQIYESKVLGADAILLIAACLTDEELAKLLTLTRNLQMTALIEVHDRAELERVLPLKPKLLGVNNRNLHDFSVNLQTCLDLRQHVPDEICFVAESGIHSRADVQRLVREGVDAILVGEAIVKEKYVGRKISELSGVTLAEVGR